MVIRHNISRSQENQALCNYAGTWIYYHAEFWGSVKLTSIRRGFIIQRAKVYHGTTKARFWSDSRAD